MFHLKTEMKTSSEQSKKLGNAAVKARISQRRERGTRYREASVPRQNHPELMPEDTGITGGISYWKKNNAIDRYSRHAENRGGHSFYEDFST